MDSYWVYIGIFILLLIATTMSIRNSMKDETEADERDAALTLNIKRQFTKSKR